MKKLPRILGKMVKEKEIEDLEVKNKIRALFILFFPTILIIALPFSLILIVIKALLGFYQFVVLKNFIDDFYDK